MQLAKVLPGSGQHPPDRFRTHGTWSVSEIALSRRVLELIIPNPMQPRQTKASSTAQPSKPFQAWPGRISQRLAGVTSFVVAPVA